MAERVYAPKPEPGPLARGLRGDKYARSRMRAAAIGAVAPHSWTADGVDYELVAAPLIGRTPLGSGMVTLRVLASVNGVPVPLRGMHPFQFVNPPVKVPDGTWRTEPSPVDGAPQDVPNFAESPERALRQMVAEHVRVLLGTGRGGAYGSMAEARRDAEQASGTTTTAYASTGDGHITSSDATYATARSGSGLTVQTASTLNTSGQTFNTPTYFCYETFIDPDTSAIPDTDAISSAVLSLYGGTDGSTTNFTNNARLFDWSTSLTTADWIAGESLSAQTLLATFPSASYVDAVYNDFTSDAAFIANVDKTGETRIILSSDRHEAGNTPTGPEYIQWSSADVAGTTQDPKLVVTHAASTPPHIGAAFSEPELPEALMLPY